MKTFYFVRHGETDYNKNRIVQGSGVDAHLNETGLLQAAQFFDYYKNVPFDTLISSGLLRSYQTIQPFEHHFSTPIIKDSRINEISWGIHEGQPGTKEMGQAYKEMIYEWSIDNLDASLPEAESAHQLASRLSSFLDELTAKNGRIFLICTHGRALKCLVCLMKKEHLREMEVYHHHNTGLYKVEWQEHSGFEVVKENNIEHIIRTEEHVPKRPIQG